jgi:hypothetical protein
MTALIALLIRLLPPTLRMREALRRMLGAALHALIDVETGCLNPLSQDQLRQMDGALRGYEGVMARLVCGHGYYRAGRALPDLAPSWHEWPGDASATHAMVLARVGRLLQLIDGLDRYADRHMARLARLAGPFRLATSSRSIFPTLVGEAKSSARLPPPAARSCAQDRGGLQPRAPPLLQPTPIPT